MLSWLFGKKTDHGDCPERGDVRSNMQINTGYALTDNSTKAKAARHRQYRVQNAIKKKLGNAKYKVFQDWERRSHDGLWITAVIGSEAAKAKVVVGRLSDIEATKNGRIKISYEPAYSKYDRTAEIELVDLRDSLRSFLLDKVAWYELHDEESIQQVRRFKKAIVKATKASRKPY